MKRFTIGVSYLNYLYQAFGHKPAPDISICSFNISHIYTIEKYLGLIYYKNNKIQVVKEIDDTLKVLFLFGDNNCAICVYDNIKEVNRLKPL